MYSSIVHWRDTNCRVYCAADEIRKVEITVKVKPSVKKICEKCKIIKRHGHVMVICENPKHKQRQG